MFQSALKFCKRCIIHEQLNNQTSDLFLSVTPSNGLLQFLTHFHCHCLVIIIFIIIIFIFFFFFVFVCVCVCSLFFIFQNTFFFASSTVFFFIVMFRSFLSAVVGDVEQAQLAKYITWIDPSDDRWMVLQSVANWIAAREANMHD